MDITNENFIKCLPEITETIQCCDFIAIDTELSGLMRERSLNRFDLPEERFAKSVESSRGYFIMQFGLSCFKRLSELRYTNRTYNFYIFPQPHKFHGDINRTFSLQAHAIQFLTEHGFDFNKLFRHGVSYLTFQEKKLITAQLKSELKERSEVFFDSQGVPTFVPSSMTSYCRKWIKKVNGFVAERGTFRVSNANESRSDSRMSSSSNNSGDPDEKMHDVSDLSSPDRLEIRDCATNHRCSVMKQVIECLPRAENLKVVRLTDTEKNEPYLVIQHVDKKLKDDELKNDFLISKGFLEIIELIIVSKRPLVGHNLTLDLIQMINQFMEPLNEDYDSFKQTCQSLFPLIYDTKYIAHSILDPKTLTNNQSRLNDLYCQLKNHNDFPSIDIQHLGVFFDEKQIPHQAGYDAYMSGYSFIVLCEAYLRQSLRSRSKEGKIGRFSSATTSSLPTNDQIIAEFANKIHLSFSYDYKCFDLHGQEDEPDRNHVFYMEYPSNWGLEDIFRVFSAYGGVEAGRLSKTSAFCALRDRRQVDAVKKMVNCSKFKDYKISSYESYMEIYKYGGRKGVGQGGKGDGTA